MKNINEFIESLVTIEPLEEGGYGHYPFQMVFTGADDGLNVAALCLGGDVFRVYKQAQAAINAGSKQLFLSLDFPASGDIEHDFVAVMSLSGKDCNCIAIPYDPKTGDVFDQITESSMLEIIKGQFLQVILN
jgi:hypothetical protein